MKLTAWNYQGIEQSLTTIALGDLLKSRNPDVFFLSETKCVGNSYWKKSRLKKEWSMDTVDSIGLSGVMIIFWKKNLNICDG